MNITISSILGGQAESFYLGGKGSFNSSIAVDPDQPTSSGNIKSSGSLIPVGYSKFSSTGLTGYPKWIVTNPKNTLTYVYDSAGNLISYTSGLTGESVISTIANATGNGFTINITKVYPVEFTLSKSSGVVSCDYLDISNSNAAGGAIWYAGRNSLDTTNNTGWIFDYQPDANTLGTDF